MTKHVLAALPCPGLCLRCSVCQWWNWGDNSDSIHWHQGGRSLQGCPRMEISIGLSDSPALSLQLRHYLVTQLWAHPLAAAVLLLIKLSS